MKGVARPASAIVSILVLAFGTLIALPAWATSYAVQPGDTVIVQGSYSSSDPNDPSEDEPLVVNAGSCSFTTFGTDSCQVRITTAGTFNVSYYVSGGDGDETVNVSVNIIHGPAQPCPIGGGGFGNTCTPLPSNDGKNNGNNNCNGATGDPIFPGDGNVHEEVVDFNGPGLLKLTRSYNSRTGWLHSFLMRLIINGNTVEALRPGGTSYQFTGNGGGGFSQDPDVNYRLTTLPSGDPSGATYKLVTDQDAVELYDANGLPLSVTARGGASVHMAYANGLLSSVTDAYGRSLTFSYDSNNRISGFTTPAGEQYSYGYDSMGRLTSVGYPDGTSVQYVYEDTDYPFLLTGVIDQKGNRTATWTYDNLGRALSESGPNGVNSYQIAYQTDDRFVQVTDPLGTVRTLNYQNAYGRLILINSDKACASFGRDVASKTVGSNGDVTRITDYKGVSTTLGYDYSRNLVTSTTRAAGTAAQVQTTTQYSPSFRLPTVIQTAGLTDQRSYDAAGNLIQRTLTDTATSAVRTTKASYNSNGLLLTRTDADGNVTTYAYDGSGNLATVTDALGHVTHDTHDADGRVLTRTDPNGLVTTYTYDPLGRVTSKTIGSEKTTYGYDAAGNLTSTTLPNGFSLTLTYDAAHRLTDVTDVFGDHLAFTLDAIGNRIGNKLYGPDNTLAFAHSRVYDALDRLQQDIGSQGQTTTYGYDANSNLTSIQDPLANTSQIAYDPLNRESQAIQPDGGTTQLVYNTLSQLTTVTDPHGVATHYQVDALNDRLDTQSPDAGDRQATFDPAGLVLTRTDAKGQMTHYSYDALQRPVSITDADGSQTTYAYDQGQYGIGHLTRMTDSSGSTTFAYNQYGRLITRTQIIAGYPFVTRYQYAPGGQIKTITYPSGKVVGYRYNHGRVTTVTINGLGVLYNVAYNALGQVDGWKFWNGQKVFRDYDTDDRMVDNEFATYGYDADSRITSIAVTGKNPQTDTIGYDSVGRVNQFDAQVFTYDLNGNRTSLAQGASQTQYGIDTASNHLTGITANGSAQPVSLDANGSTLSQGQNQLSYDAAGRLSAANGTATYRYDGFGERAEKDLPKVSGGLLSFLLGPDGDDDGDDTTRTGFVYGAPGQLLGQYGTDGRLQETLWLGKIPVVAMTRWGNYAIHSDQLNTPRQIANGLGFTVWTLPYSAFGTAQPNSSGLIYNLRFAGQYYDAETGLNQNYFRDYDPSTGRYVEADPIGLAGGANPYVYVTGNPLSLTDSTGRDPLSAAVGIALGGAAGYVNGLVAGDTGQALQNDILAGAATGGIIGLTDGLSLLEGPVGYLIRAAISSAGEATRQAANSFEKCGQINFDPLGLAEAAGLSSFADVLSNGPGAGIAESLLNGTDSQYYNALKSSVGAIGSGLAAVPITVLAQ